MTYDQELYVRQLLGDVAGVPPGEVGLAFETDTFTGDGSTTVFHLSNSPASSYPTVVLVSAVIQQNPEVWSKSGTTLTFVNPPSNTAPISVVYTH